MTFTTRDMRAEDIPACVAIINHIIGLGGSTAYEDPYSQEGFAAHYFEEAEVSNVVLSGDRIIGFQGAFEVEKGVFSIGSFTDQKNPVRGAGFTIFEKTKADCRRLGGTSIIAKITSDNTAGLAYYSKMGFVDNTVMRAEFTRRDGTVLDRIIKRFVL